MTEPPTICPECGAARPDGLSCADDFHRLLFWEFEYPELGAVHHLAVLCYHLQHPSLYSQAGLEHAAGLLRGFVAGGIQPQAARRRMRGAVSSTGRDWKITARPGDHGSYGRAVGWAMTIADVAAGGPENYIENVRRWAAETIEAIGQARVER